MVGDPEVISRNLRLRIIADALIENRLVPTMYGPPRDCKGTHVGKCYCTCFVAGGFHVPSMIDGGVSFGQYSRSMGMNLAFGAGSQLASLALPGESAWRYRSTEPSALVTNLLRDSRCSD